MAFTGPMKVSSAAVANEFELHELPVEDAISAHQRAKMERYGSTLFLVLLPARYLDDVEKVEFGELHVFVGPNFVITVRHAESPNLHLVRHRLENAPELLCMGPEAILYAILDQVVDEYAPVVAGLENDIDEIEDQLFGGDPAVSKRIYALFAEIIEFQRAVHPLMGILNALEGGFEKYGVDIELQRNLRDVADHVTRVVEQVDGSRALLQNALSVNATLVAQQQNDEMRSMTETSLAQNEEVKKICLGLILSRADAGRHRLRDECGPCLNCMAIRLPHGDRGDDRHGVRAVFGVQTAPLVVTPRRRPFLHARAALREDRRTPWP